MGPFSYIPGMECRHAVYSMKHTVNGEIRVNEQIIRFKNDMGYMEGDSGTSFPDRYIWTQHFIPESVLQELSDSFSTETENIALPHIWGHRS